MTHQCLSFSKLSLMMTFKLGKSIDLSLHTGINLSFLSHPNLILIKRSKNIPRHQGANKINFSKFASCFTHRLKYELHFFHRLARKFYARFWEAVLEAINKGTESSSSVPAVSVTSCFGGFGLYSLQKSTKHKIAVGKILE